jgi:toluene monooxygenase system protein E
MSEQLPVRKLKTYTHFGGARRIPTEYEVVSSRLHYHYPYKFELPAQGNPVVAWYYRHREGSRLQAQNWEAFQDPRKTTYRGYNERQDAKETVVDGLLREIDEVGYDGSLSPEWVSYLHRWYGPLRYPIHGLQMVAAYVAQMAPASTLTICQTFQAADEMRRLQRIVYRSVQIDKNRGGMPSSEHQGFWEEAEAFQPLRELIERLLIAYDFGEAFVALNLVVKPHLDRLINEEFAGGLAPLNGDTLLRDIHFSLNEDAVWHREVAAEFVRVAVEDTPANAAVINEWIELWRPRAEAAVDAFAEVLGEAPSPVEAALAVKRVATAAEDDARVAVPVS